MFNDNLLLKIDNLGLSVIIFDYKSIILDYQSMIKVYKMKQPIPIVVGYPRLSTDIPIYFDNRELQVNNLKLQVDSPSNFKNLGFSCDKSGLSLINLGPLADNLK